METPEADRPSPRAWEALFPSAILVLRFAFGTRQAFYLDWMVLLSVYWILYVFLSRRRAMPAVTAATIVALFALYLSRTLPHLVDTFLLCR